MDDLHTLKCVLPAEIPVKVPFVFRRMTTVINETVASWQPTRLGGVTDGGSIVKPFSNFRSFCLIVRPKNVLLL